MDTTINTGQVKEIKKNTIIDWTKLKWTLQNL